MKTYKLPKLLQVLVFTLILLSSPSVAFAQVDPLEQAREDALSEQLLLQLPLETDNPNYTVVFTDPSQAGVFVSIDGAKYLLIESPYVLPSLAIGDHKVAFKFTDNEEAEQVLDKMITVIPRAPQINPPEGLGGEAITITGTALPSGDLMFYMSGAAKTYSAKITVDEEGSWEYIVEGPFDDAIYNITAVVRKDGYASYYADGVTFKIENAQQVEENETEETTLFILSDILGPKFTQTFLDNPDLTYYSLGVLFTGLLISTLVHTVLRLRRNKDSEKKFMKLLGRKEKAKSAKKTRKEKKRMKMASKVKDTVKEPADDDNGGIKNKISANGENKKDKKQKKKKGKAKSKKSQKKEKSKKEPKEEKPDKVEEISKEDFLEQYKDFDPDNKKGKESKGKKEEKKERNIKLTLTSGKLD